MICIAQPLKKYLEDGTGRYRKYGYKSGSRVMIEPRWDFVEEFSDGLAIVKSGDAYGVINEKGKYLVPPRVYDYIRSFSEGLAVVNKGGKRNDIGGFQGGKWGFINAKGKLVIPLQYDAAGDLENGRAPVSTGDKWGFIDKTGKMIVPLKYDYAQSFFDGYAKVNVGARRNPNFFNAISGGLYTFIDVSGKEIIPTIFANAHEFRYGRAQVQSVSTDAGIKGKLGFIDRTGRSVVPREYDLAEDFSDGMAAVNKGGTLMNFSRKNGKWGYVDTTGKLVIPLIYDNQKPFVKGTAVVANDLDYDGYGKYGLIDKTGKEVVPPGKYEYIMRSDAEPKLLWYRKDKKYGLMNDAGTVLTDAVYDNIFFRNDGTAEVTQGKNYGVLDKNGKTIVPAKYSFVGNPENGYIHVIQYTYEHGYYDTSGAEVIPAGGGIDTIWGVNEDMLIVEKAKHYGFADMKLKKFISQKPYDAVGRFKEGLAAVSNNKKWGFVDKTGKETIALTFDNCNGFSEGLAGVNKGATIEYSFPQGGKWGFIDKTGKQVVPCKYDDAGSFTEGMASVNVGGKASIFGAKGGKWGFIDKTGKEVIPPVYDAVYDFANGQAWVTKDGRSYYIDKTGKEIR
jgi:hypothetical protein